MAYLDTGTGPWWGVGFVLYAGDDIVLTVGSEWVPATSRLSVVEVNPLIVEASRWLGGRLPALVAVKLAVVGLVAGLWWRAPWPDRVLVPMLVTVAGALVVGWNGGMLVTVFVGG